MQRDGGFQPRSERPAIALVCFSGIDDSLHTILLESLENCIDTIRADLPVRLDVSWSCEPNPIPMPAVNQQQAYYPVLDTVESDIVLVITNAGFCDPGRGRFVFGYGGTTGQGILSTYRFRKESAGNRQLLAQLGKQIIKILAMACTLDTCADPQCVVSYHRYVDDLDRNRYLCRSCRRELARCLSFFLQRERQDTADTLW